jgi:hypothetical protein
MLFFSIFAHSSRRVTAYKPHPLSPFQGEPDSMFDRLLSLIEAGIYPAPKFDFFNSPLTLRQLLWRYI